MSKKTFKKDKKGHSEEWEWEETEEVRAALERLHNTYRDKQKEDQNEQSS